MNVTDLNLAIHRLRTGWAKPAFTDDDLATWRRELAAMDATAFARGLEAAKRRPLPQGEFRPAPFEFTAILATLEHRTRDYDKPVNVPPPLTPAERVASEAAKEAVMAQLPADLALRRDGTRRTAEVP